MNYEYIRLLMEYSDARYPYKKAKADPGLAEGLKSVRQYLTNNSTRRESSSDLNRTLLLEKQIKAKMMIEERIRKMNKERDEE